MYIENIPKLDADTILCSELYCEILEMDDEVLKARILLAVQEKAKLLGKKTEFEMLFRAYVKQQKKYDAENKQLQPRLNEIQNDGLTHFSSGKYQDYKCGVWIANESGVKTITMFGENVACPHPILPVQILINAETGLCKVKLAFRIRKRWNEVIVDKEVISSSNKIVSLSKYCIGVTSENARYLVQYLSDMEMLNEETITEQVTTSKLGWIRGEFMPYGENIIFDNEQSFKTVFNSVRERGSRDVWYQLIKEIRSNGRFEPYINLIASLASPIIEMVNGLPFVVDTYGKTGKGKTVALMLASSVWANPSDNEYVTDPKTTITALELRLDFLNNLPMLIDDMAQLKNKYEGDFSELVYFLCSGKGKDRANQNMGINKATTWKNVMIVNSEHSMVTETMQGGAINRIIDIEAKPGAFFENGNYVVEILKENYGFCGKEFIELLKEIGVNRVREMQKDFSSKIVECAKKIGVEKEEKQIIPMSILLTADKLATDNLFLDGKYLDLDYCVSLLKSKGEVSEDERAYEFIMSEVAININKFKPDNAGYYKGECWGIIEDGHVIIAINVFNSIAKRGNFSSLGFLSWAKKKDLLQLSSDGKNSKTKRLDGSPSRCIFLKLLQENTQNDAEFKEIDQETQKELPFL